MQVSVKLSPSIHDITSTTYVRYLRLHVNLYEHGSTRSTPSFPALRLQTKNLVLTWSSYLFLYSSLFPWTRFQLGIPFNRTHHVLSRPQSVPIRNTTHPWNSNPKPPSRAVRHHCHADGWPREEHCSCTQWAPTTPILTTHTEEVDRFLLDYIRTRYARPAGRPVLGTMVRHQPVA